MSRYDHRSVDYDVNRDEFKKSCWVSGMNWELYEKLDNVLTDQMKEELIRCVKKMVGDKWEELLIGYK